MSEVIVIRILPHEPVGADVFASALNGISIDVYDLSLKNSKDGVIIGTATGVLPISNDKFEIITVPDKDNIKTLKTAIVQHFFYQDPLNTEEPPTYSSVATAIVLLNRPVGHTEVPGPDNYDLRLVVTSGQGVEIPTSVEYSIAGIEGIDLTNSGDASLLSRVAIFKKAAAAYVYIPHFALVSYRADGIGVVRKDPNGTPPPFKSLVDAINTVLTKEDVALEKRTSPLTVPESAHVASELVWNRVMSPPPHTPADLTLSNWYTAGHPDPDPDNKEGMKRLKFEKEMTAYEATLSSDTMWLSNFVFSASAAIDSEKRTWSATEAAFTFPIESGANSDTSVPTGTVILTRPSDTASPPPFPVPAAFFYAISTAFTPAIKPEQRYNTALINAEARLIIEMQAAVDSGVILAVEPFSTGTSSTTINAYQAARRITALGGVNASLSQFKVKFPLSNEIPSFETIVSGWLDFQGASANLVPTFWKGPTGKIVASPQGYLTLLLWVITEGSQDLIKAIIKDSPAGLGVKDVGALVAVTDQKWRQFFGAQATDPNVLIAHPDLLPKFLKFGDITQKTQAWVVYLGRFFQVSIQNIMGPPGQFVPPPEFGAPSADLLSLFITAYATASNTDPKDFTFAGELDSGFTSQAIGSIFPRAGQEDERACLLCMITTLNDLVRITQIGKDALRFSLIEALYSRGFISKEKVAGTPSSRFQSSLRGTIAFESALPIREKARQILGLGPDDPSSAMSEEFAPINPEGHLVNCIPPEHLSPIGLIEYLHEILNLTPNADALSGLVAKRRGMVDLLDASVANLDVPVPLIDLVNESLEALASHPSVPVGQIYNTSNDPSVNRTPRLEILPENSSPALLVKSSQAYENLRKSFDAHCLPYSQNLDVCRSYLCRIGTTRFQVMRTFRKEIVDFPMAVTDATRPLDFESFRWRLPVHFDIALEYLCISREEYDVLYGGDLIERDRLCVMYGFPAPMTGLKDAPSERAAFLRRSLLSTAPEFQCTPSDTPAPEWEENHSYEVGDLVRYQGRLFEARQAHLSLPAWTPGGPVPALWRTPTPCGVTEWLVQTHYSVGSVVTYQGQKYRCRIDHTSDAQDWTPPNTPALWVLTDEPATRDPPPKDPPPKDPPPKDPPPKDPPPKDPPTNDPPPKDPPPKDPPTNDPPPKDPPPKDPPPKDPPPKDPPTNDPPPKDPPPKDPGKKEDWTDVITKLDEFLYRVGISYCEFVEFVKSGFVLISCSPEPSSTTYPDCEPCCISQLRVCFQGKDKIAELRKTIVFIRLWRSLQCCCKGRITFAMLAKICRVLNLFADQIGTVNHDFIRQLAALLMMTDYFGVPLDTLLPLYATPFNPAVLPNVSERIIECLEHVLVHERRCRLRDHSFKKLLADNFGALSLLAGFLYSDHWYDHPTHTIRFLEVLCRLYQSRFTVGEVEFLFTVLPHLPADDPFPLQEHDEAIQDPLELPEDSRFHLWALRCKLLDVSINDEEAECWSWHRIISSLHRLGYTDMKSVFVFAEHFFPAILESFGRPVSPEKRRFMAELTVTDASMWNPPDHGPFTYSGSHLSLRLPLKDGELLRLLRNLRPLSQAEQDAVRNLYFAPRAMLAPFAAIFEDFNHAAQYLVSCDTDEHRWRFFRQQFAKFYQRCEIVAHHLAEHVVQTVHHKDACDEDRELAWKILRHLLADENTPRDSSQGWEPSPVQTTSPPTQFLWETHLSGGAFAAILGLVGTGLVQEYYAQRGDSQQLVWRDTTSDLDVFGNYPRNNLNVPVPTILPVLQTPTTILANRYITVRNGIAIRDMDDKLVGGTEPFEVCWRGCLLVDRAGEYEFRAGQPSCCSEKGCSHLPCHAQWAIKLKRGQKEWELVDHDPETCDADPCNKCGTACLRRGAYDIEVRFSQRDPRFTDPDYTDEHVNPVHTGFQLQYRGPDTCNEYVTVPHKVLFSRSKTTNLAYNVSVQGGQPAHDFLTKQYYSTFRDIRRTYQRAFKSVLLSRRFDLSAMPEKVCDGVSEIEFLLGNPRAFQGTSYYRQDSTSRYLTHAAELNFNLLPVNDPYEPPTPDKDARVNPSPQRQAALFDWFERLFQYTVLRGEVCHSRRWEPLWSLFYEAKTQNPVSAAQLLLHLGIDVSLAPIALSYMSIDSNPGPGNPLTLSSAQLTDERWAYRVWKAGEWIKQLKESFYTSNIEFATPALWASGSGTMSSPPQTAVGNYTLTKFVFDSLVETLSSPAVPNGYIDLTALNNGLRLRARAALTAYLCTGNKTSLAVFETQKFARNTKDLSNLLLIDVDCDVREKITRISDAIQATQTLVQRARLGLEPGIIPLPKFLRMWQKVYETFKCWQSWRKRELYSENWIQWYEAEQVRKSESGQFLERELRRVSHTFPLPPASKWWNHELGLPSTGPLQAIQDRDRATFKDISSVPDEGLALMGIPEIHGRPNWVTAFPNPPRPENQTPKLHGENSRAVTASSDSSPSTSKQLTSLTTETRTVTDVAGAPLWIQSAIRMGTSFIRIAAAGLPPAIAFPASWCVEGDTVGGGGCCLSESTNTMMDEYWFWIADANFFKDNHHKQNADIGSKDRLDPSSYWDDPKQLPTLLQWTPYPLVYLYWTRVRQGRFDPPHYSDGGVEVASISSARLQYIKRTGDSLTFTITGAVARPGYPTPDTDTSTVQTGFRYDLPEDRAIVIPNLAKEPAAVTGKYAAPLTAHPFFMYFSPGAPIQPPSRYGVALTIAATLRSRCCFETALKWCEIAYNPLLGGNKWEYCQKSPPDPNQTQSGNAITSIRDKPCCSQIARNPETARRRAVTLLYLEILLDWSDWLKARATPESYRQAEVTLDCISHLLGPHPDAVRATDLSTDTTSAVAVKNFVPSPAALNPRLLAIYDSLIDRKAHLHQLIAESRQPQSPSSFCTLSPLDAHCGGCSCPSPGSYYRFIYLLPKAIEMAGMVRALGSALLSAFEKGDTEYLSSLRLTHEKQIQVFTLDLRQDQWRESDWQLQALEKSMENAQTRLTHLRNLIAGGLNSGEIGYQTSTETSMTFRDSSTTMDTTAQSMGSTPDMWMGIAGIAGTPLEFQQITVGVKLAHGFSTAARILNTLSEKLSTQSSLMSTQGGWDRREQEWRHQADTTSIEIEQIKRQMLAAKRRCAITLRELNIHTRQIEQTEEVEEFLRDKFTKHDLYLFLQTETAALYRQAHDLAVSYAKDALKTFLYERGDYVLPHSVKQSSAIHHLMMTLKDGGWDSLREGLLAGERLELSLRMLERGYVTANAREYELTKHVSLRALFPLAYLCLKMTGKCEFTLPEWLFDLEYPGHYMRRIKSVSLTIPCVTGPYAGVRCHLKLLNSSVRVDPLPYLPPKACCCRKEGGCTCELTQSAYVVTSPDDPRIIRRYYHNLRPEMQTSSMIATSSGQMDSGMFDTNLRQDERYLPFEYCGVVDSAWSIELPPQENQFDLNSVSDVVVHINYTAREGGNELRAAARESVRCYLPDHGLRYIDARHDLADMWYKCFSEGDMVHGKDGNIYRQMQHQHCQDKGCRTCNSPHHLHDHDRKWKHRFNIVLSRTMFPFIPLSRLNHDKGRIVITCIDIFIETCPGSCEPQKPLSCCCCEDTDSKSGGAHIDLVFRPPECCAPHSDVPAVVRCGWGEGIYHGILEFKDGDKESCGLEVSCRGGGGSHADRLGIGALFFPPGVYTEQAKRQSLHSEKDKDGVMIQNVFFIVSYKVEGLGNKCASGKGCKPIGMMSKDAFQTRMSGIW